ncbi:hypothetical protein [Microbulbifer sp.]|uniref:hypothetical protein n=1 Tax=Microbulbifer sp. TaxID=1908541 RepID=UPI002588B640|nr:hypothetical protein [Microbulbifer sp.]
MKNTFLALNFFPLSVAGLLAVAFHPALQAQTLVTCPLGVSQITYSPGLTNTPQMVYYEGIEMSGPCVAATNPELISFTSTFSGYALLSCTNFSASPLLGDQIFTWNTGGTSEWHYDTVGTTTVGGTTVLLVEGPISSGVLEGAQVEQVVSHVNPNALLCSTPVGVSTVTGPSAYVFLSL